jgi:hypothetical protein
MPYDPRSPRWSTPPPVPADGRGQVRVVLANVVQVIGYRTLDVTLAVVFEQLEQLENRAWVFLERS